MEIVAKRHPGCWASDTSLKFPDVTFNLCLNGYDDSYYEVSSVFCRNDKPVPRDDLSKIVAEIGGHQLIESVEEESLPNAGFPQFSIKIHDHGYTEGLIRPILHEKNALFPQFQKMRVQRGEETIYALFYNEKAVANVTSALNSRIGANLIEFRPLKLDGKGSDVPNLIPAYFDLVLPEELVPMWHRIMKDFTAKTWNEETESVWVKFIEKVSEHPQLFKWIVRVLSFFFGISLGKSQ